MPVTGRRRFSLPVTSLHPGQMFVFGSNLRGFHGAGSAGLAFRGTAENTWRDDPAFLAALRAPVGSPLRVGRWAVLGVGEGLMRGQEGWSYAVPTVTRPGARRSIPLWEILASLRRLGEVARLHPELGFLCAIVGGGYNGYTEAEIDGVYYEWEGLDAPPLNVLFPLGYGGVR